MSRQSVGGGRSGGGGGGEWSDDDDDSSVDPVRFFVEIRVGGQLLPVSFVLLFFFLSMRSSSLLVYFSRSHLFLLKNNKTMDA